MLNTERAEELHRANPLYRQNPEVELSRLQEQRLREIIREELKFALAQRRSDEPV